MMWRAIAGFFCWGVVAGSAAFAADVKQHFSDQAISDQLAARGIYLYGNYTGDFASNVHGGERPHHATYVQQEQAGLILQMDKLMGLKGGWLQATFTNRHGHDLANRYINSGISAQEIYGAGQTYRLSNLSYTQTLAQGKILLQAGRVAAMDGFFTSSSFCLFQSGAVCNTPVLITENSNATSAPLASWGGRIKVKLTPSLIFSTGAYQSAGTDYLDHSRHGFYWGRRYDPGLWLPVELKYQTDSSQAAYPTMLALGGALDTSNGRDGKNRKYHERGVFWAQAERMIWKGNHSGSRGISLFSAALFSPSKKQSYSYELFGGFHFDGPFKQRPDDVLAVMGTILRANKNFRNQVSKHYPNYITFEANYRYQLGSAIQITPNVQYIIHPDGNGLKGPPRQGHIRNALVLGTQVYVDLGALLKFKAANMPN